MSLVTVRDLVVCYRGAPALRGLSFTVGPGESYGLVGESGSGKSTAAMALTRYLPRGATLSAAELTVAGISVRDLDPAKLREYRSSALAVVYQEPGLALNPIMRAGEQIAEVYRLRGDGRTRARERTADALRRVRLDPALAARYPHELSGGQQQRVVIAMALACEPKLLILDEPTTGLDAQVEAEIMALIDTLRDELGFANILISHNLPLVAAHCQRIGVLRGGELVEEGATADVLLAPQHPYTQALIAALPRIDTPRGSANGDTADPLVTLDRVSKSYHRKPVLRDISFSIGRGEVLGLVGGSGSGKTTLGLAIAGLASHEGEIRFDVDDRKRGRRTLRGKQSLPRTQTVFQNPDASLNPRRTVRQVLTRSIELLDGTKTAEELVADTGLDTSLLDKLPAQLSGGQKQRVAIARAFAGHVPLVICDEPTSALDVSTQARILGLLTDMQRRTGVSYLFISHDLAVVRQISDRVGVLRDGELVELKPADEIFTRPEHPYTKSLVDSALSMRRGYADRAAVLDQPTVLQQQLLDGTDSAGGRLLHPGARAGHRRPGLHRRRGERVRGGGLRRLDHPELRYLAGRHSDGNLGAGAYREAQGGNRAPAGNAGADSGGPRRGHHGPAVWRARRSPPDPRAQGSGAGR
jgi:peptide/nickel transport system ATP-binding protein